MLGCLEDLFNVRTNGNGYIGSEWDDILLKRDLKRLLEQGQIKELQVTTADRRAACDKTWFRDCGTGDTYEYTANWDIGGPRFCKLGIDDLCKTPPKGRPI